MVPCPNSVGIIPSSNKPTNSVYVKSNKFAFVKNEINNRVIAAVENKVLE